MQSDSFKSQVEDVTKDGSVLKWVLDHDACDF